jgi:hypothetical protein
MGVSVRSAAYVIAAGVFLLVALFSVRETWPATWDRLSQDQERFGALSPERRARMPGRAIPLPMWAFDFFKRRLAPGTRYYMQVVEGGFGTADFKTTVRTLGSFYLLPAVMVRNPADADVILSWGVNPHELGLAYSWITKLGPHEIFVSKVEHDG